MAKLGRARIIFLFLAAQTILAISIGLAVLFSGYKNNIPPNTYVGNINVGDLSREEAKEKIEYYYDGIMHDKSLIIKLDGNKKFKIDYSGIDASLDSKATIRRAYGRTIPDRVFGIINGYFFYDRINKITPVINYNEGKLRKELDRMAKAINCEPVNASVLVEDKNIIKKKGSAGIVLNIENAMHKLADEMGSSLESFIEFNTENNYEVESVQPGYTSQYFEDADVLISQYSTEINPSLSEDSFNIAVYAINGVSLEQADSKDAEEFSFDRCLDEKAKLTKNNEGYDIVASTLYKALLMAGIDHTDIVRTPHKETVNYIEPGLDVRILNGEADLRFKNTLGYKLYIFASVKDSKVTVSLVGNAENKDSQSYKIETEVIQKFSPAVVNEENQQLKQGEKKVVYPGKEGIKVNVYRVVQKDGNEVERQFLYDDKYDAIDKIVEIGPDTEWKYEAGLK